MTFRGVVTRDPGEGARRACHILDDCIRMATTLILGAVAGYRQGLSAGKRIYGESFFHHVVANQAHRARRRVFVTIPGKFSRSI